METFIAVLQFAAWYGIGFVGATLYVWAWFYPYSFDKFDGVLWGLVIAMAIFGPAALLFGCACAGARALMDSSERR